LAKAATREDSWGEAVVWSKSTLGTTDATGGWIIPNAIVDEIIKPATVENIYRSICTVVPGVTSAAVDIPFRAALPARALVIAAGQTKTNLDLAYNGYTATMYTLAQIYDIGNQFLRTSRGAAERDVLSELATGFAVGEAYYIREGSGSSEPFGYTSALTNGPAAFRSTFTPSATTLAGSIATSIATAAGALSGRGHSSRDLSAVLAATSYWTMLSQGTDTAGFFFAPANGPEAINAPAGTLITPFGIPVYPDAAADVTNTAAVVDNLVVGNWKKFKIYFGQSYRVDSSDQAGTRWDTNLTGFRGEEEMGFDARPAVYSGNFQMITDILP
jgi:HK97 family phage major capsid protein